MIRVCIVCEGQTEVEFVKSCLAPYLLNDDVQAFPSLLRSPSGNHRGGRVTVERLVKFISHQYNQTDRITTLVDFYGFQDSNGRSRAQLEHDIRAGVASSTTGYDARYVLPYVQMYEFEGLLFTEPSAFEWVEDGWNEQSHMALTQVRQAFASPEDINNSRETAPSKRILSIFESGTYSKTEHGPLIAEAIGVDAIREQCPQFDAWLTQLQAWGN
ncbi:hypothetical protein Cthiooxydans_14570 [Comamonas thiooxydans]|uniref:DUF4276 family protein n=1 Tax=Comamonas thiooxydans TaxID=363952 RepID=UPI0021FD9993|nr:DUF4276 family protein [Comamonas thiooxydans]BDB69045.1 hypothetical protein Cthiooxydans_14570 [Comamonas thiooxydans]